MVDTDILVVGGGPAGVISALTAAREGHKVILIDAKSDAEIGNKTCGDAITLGPLKLLEEELAIPPPFGDEVSDDVEQLRLRTEKINFPFFGDGFVLNRHPYGQRLLNLAKKIVLLIIKNSDFTQCTPCPPKGGSPSGQHCRTGANWRDLYGY